MKTQKGFTLIELITVVAVIGILAAVSVPVYMDVAGDARLTAAESLADQLTSSAHTNYNLCSNNNDEPEAGKGVAITTAAGADGDAGCVAAATALSQAGDDPNDNYTITGATALGLVGVDGTLGTSYRCTLTSTADANATADFTVIQACFQ